MIVFFLFEGPAASGCESFFNVKTREEQQENNLAHLLFFVTAAVLYSPHRCKKGTIDPRQGGRYGVGVAPIIKQAAASLKIFARLTIAGFTVNVAISALPGIALIMRNDLRKLVPFLLQMDWKETVRDGLESAFDKKIGTGGSDTEAANVCPGHAACKVILVALSTRGAFSGGRYVRMFIAKLSGLRAVRRRPRLQAVRIAEGTTPSTYHRAKSDSANAFCSTCLGRTKSKHQDR